MKSAKVLFLAALLGASSRAQTGDSPAFLAFNQVEFQLERFYAGPSTLNRPTLTAKYRVQLERECGQKADCAKEVSYPIIEAMLAELKDAHTGLVWPVNDPTRASSVRLDSLGVVADRDSQPGLVLEVLPLTPAARAGLQRGDILLSADKVLWQDYDFSKPSAARIAIKFFHHGKLTTQKIKTAPLEPENYMPFMQTFQGVKYLRIPTFFQQGVGLRVQQLVRAAQQQGYSEMILDVRDNGGGFSRECMSAANTFVNPVQMMERTVQAEYLLSSAQGVWSQGHRELKSNAAYETYTADFIEPYRPWKGRTLVLTNHNTASCAELFSYFLQKIGNIRVFGEKTLGITNGATRSQELFGGGYLYITLASSFTPQGKLLPYSIQPDLELSEDLKTLSQTGRDVLLERALKKIKNQ